MYKVLTLLSVLLICSCSSVKNQRSTANLDLTASRRTPTTVAVCTTFKGGTLSVHKKREYEISKQLVSVLNRKQHQSKMTFVAHKNRLSIPPESHLILELIGEAPVHNRLSNDKLLDRAGVASLPWQGGEQEVVAFNWTVSLRERSQKTILKEELETLRSVVDSSVWGTDELDLTISYKNTDTHLIAKTVEILNRNNGPILNARISQAAPMLCEHGMRPLGCSQCKREHKAPGRVRNVYVLIISVAKYEDPNIPKLNYSNKDGAAIYDFFKNNPRSPAQAENVFMISDSPNSDGLSNNLRGIRMGIDKYLLRKAVNADDMVILYYAGHGDVGAHITKGTEYYLIPRDAKKGSLAATAIDMPTFQELWDQIEARRKVFIVDACNSGGFSGVRGAGFKGFEDITEAEAEAAAEAKAIAANTKVTSTVKPKIVKGLTNRSLSKSKAVFSACRADQKSLESDKLKHGIFTYTLLSGLKGAADENNDGNINLRELKSYLTLNVPEEARRQGGSQTPVIKIQLDSEVFLSIGK